MRNARRSDWTYLNGPIFMWIGLFLILASVSGCSNSNPYKVVAVKGTLKLDGEPVSGVRLTFTPKEGRPSIATTDSEGRFEPWYRAKENGVQVGVHKVFVERADPDDLMDLEVSGNPLVNELIERFGHSGTESFEVEITEATDSLVVDLPAAE